MPDPVLDLSQTPARLEIHAGPNRYLLEISGVHLWPLLTEPDPPLWVLPVGSEKYPHWAWYCAQAHTWTKARPTGHTGLDINVQLGGKGDVDFHEPIYFVASGNVCQVGQSAGWLGVVVVQHQHDGNPIWFRYAHLDPATINVEAGQYVTPAQTAGLIGAFPNGGDHLHLDAALSPFNWNAYRDPNVQWTDPRKILEAHVAPFIVGQMLRDKDSATT